MNMNGFDVRQLILEMDMNWMPVIAATVCGTGALYLFLKWRNDQKIQKKILKARKRRDESLQQAEQAVQQFKMQV